MSGSVVIQSFCLASTVVQFDRFVARNQPLAILPPLSATLKTSIVIYLNYRITIN